MVGAEVIVGAEREMDRNGAEDTVRVEKEMNGNDEVIRGKCGSESKRNWC